MTDKVCDMNTRICDLVLLLQTAEHDFNINFTKVQCILISIHHDTRPQLQHKLEFAMQYRVFFLELLYNY